MKPPLKWIIVRLGDDMNWWVDETSENVYWGADSLSMLDPRQFTHLRDSIGRYKKYGLDPDQLAKSFSLFEVASELSDGRLKLVPSDHELDDEGVQFFALPDIRTDEEGEYPVFLDQLSSAHIKFLNDTHDYHEDVTQDEMEEDIQTRNNDRYFAASALHAFNELDDVLTWAPAEWDDGQTIPRLADSEDDESEGRD